MTATTPRWLSVEPSTIPCELTADPSWYPATIRPKLGKVGVWDKIPSDPETAAPAKWSDPSTRCTFDQAFMAYQRDPRFGGIGYLLHGDAGVVGIDLDHCVDEDGAIAPWAQQIVDSFPASYWERSISGTGLRGFTRGSLGDVGGVRSKIEGCSVEVYADQRFLVITGNAIATVEQLTDEQAAIDALRARLTAGRVRATGTAIGSGLTGPNTTPSPEVLAIVEATMSDRHGQHLGEIWFRDELHVAGASEDDWALACEVVYQALRLGHRGEDLAQLVEQTMRAGPYRSKWDERRGGVTWLAQDVANAIATTLKRLGDRPITPARPDGLVDEDTTPTDETPAQIIARLERQLAEERLAHAQTRSVAAVQMSRIRALSADLEDISERLAGWKAVLSNPNLKPADRIVAIPVIESVKAAQANGQDEIHIRYPGIVNAWGIPESTVAKSVAVVTEMVGAPLAKRNDQQHITFNDPETGQLVEASPMRTLVRAVTDGDLYDAIATYNPGLPQRGGRRLPSCKDHPSADVIIRSVTTCATCRKPIAPAREQTLRRQNEVIGETDRQTVSGVNLRLQNEVIGGYDGEEMAERAAAMVQIPLDHEVDHWKTLAARAPVDLESIRAAREREQEPPDWLDEWPDDYSAQSSPQDLGPGEVPSVFLV